MKLIRILRGKGVSREGLDGTWQKEYVGLEAELDVGDDVEAVDRALTGKLDTILRIMGTAQPTTAKPKPVQPVNYYLELLDWKPFKTGREGGWIFASTPEAKALVERLKATPEKTLVEGSFRYRLSGEGDRFLQRFPHKA